MDYFWQRMLYQHSLFPSVIELLLQTGEIQRKSLIETILFGYLIPYIVILFYYELPT